MSFIAIWEQSKHLSPGARQTWVRSELSTSLQKAGLTARSGGSGGGGDRIVLGIAEYCRDDLLLLDSLLLGSRKGLLLEVFLMTECKSQAALEVFIPGLGPVFHSPVVGIWTAGRIKTASGHAARELLRAEFPPESS